VADGTAVVLSTSHLRAGKGIDVLPGLAAQLGADARDAVVVAAGGGPLAGELAAAARDLGVPPDRLRFLGPRLDVPRLLAAADLFVFPSNGAEGLPLGPLEALASGVPLVATAVSDLPELLGGAAVLVPPGDDDAFVDACRRLLDDDGRRAELARRGETLVRERLSVGSAVEAHLRRYFG
jgi:glycosyltransferase involved in cell wall biosynthesis